MLSLLTKYLLQYKRVSIPHIGSFELVQEAPQWRVSDQLCTPPSFVTAYSRPDSVPEHQSHFFSSAGDLASFGRQLRHRLRKGPIQWKGFGVLRDTADQVVFEPQPHTVAALQPVPAQKVLRPHATHQVLVGDQQVSRQLEAPPAVPRQRPDWEIIIAWILLALAAASIIVLLVLGQFSPQAVGLRPLWPSS